MYIVKNSEEKTIEVGGIRYNRNNPIVKIEMVWNGRKAKVERLDGRVRMYSAPASKHILDILS